MILEYFLLFPLAHLMYWRRAY